MPTALRWSNINDADKISFLYPGVISFSNAGDNEVIAAVTGQQVMIYRLFLVVADATNLTFKDGANTNLTGAMPFAANGSLVIDISNFPWFQTSYGKAFIINSSQPVQVSGKVDYQQV